MKSISHIYVIKSLKHYSSQFEIGISNAGDVMKVFIKLTPV